MWPAARVQPGQHQNRPDAHHAEAQRQASACHSAQRQAEPGHQEAALSFTRPFGVRLVVEVYSADKLVLWRNGF